MCDFSFWRRFPTILDDSPGFAAMQEMVCIGLVVEPTTDMMMTTMEARTKTGMDMAMAEEENGALEMSIGIVMMEIVMRITTADMVAEMMITNVDQEAGE